MAPQDRARYCRARAQRNGNLYPTHGLGPVAWYMGINRGDRLDSIVSMTTAEFGLTKWRSDKEPRGTAKWNERYVCGDVNVSLIKTARGRVIRLEHDVTSPRPLGDKARGAGHGGMDYVMAWRCVQWFREGLAPDFDVYDAAACSVPGPLSEQSVAKGSAPIRFPDFTRGA
jgi:hypothetical protein